MENSYIQEEVDLNPLLQSLAKWGVASSSSLSEDSEESIGSRDTSTDESYVDDIMDSFVDLKASLGDDLLTPKTYSNED